MKAVSEHYLLQGAVFALEQCQRLLQSAVTLYNNGDYSTSVVLAMYSHEELGRYWILRKLREGVVAEGASVTIDEIERHCDDHVMKQAQGTGGTTLSAPRDSVIGQAMSVRPGDPDYWSARQLIEDAVRAKRKRLPNDRHEMRMRSLYVEPNDDGWNRPSDQEQVTARDAICEAANAYSMSRQRVVGYGDDSDEEFVNAMDAWAECPKLLSPVWPNMPEI